MKCLQYLVLTGLLLLSVSLRLQAQHAGDDAKVETIPVSPEMEAAAQKALRECVPDSKFTGEINKNRVYTLTGDFWSNGHNYALVDDDQDIVLCEWEKTAWKAISGINVGPVWNFPAGYRAPLEGRTPLDQPRPFWLLNLQGRSLLIIASQVEKAGQYYDVLLFDSGGGRILDTASSFGPRPETKGGYLVTGDISRGKAEWEASYFSKIRDNKFHVQKTWEGSQPWHATDRDHQPDDSSNYASSDGKGYVILPDNSGSKSPADYLIIRCDPGHERPSLHPLANEPFAAIYNTKKQANGVGDPAILYLFDRLTGLPKELYPGYDANLDKTAREAPANIFVVKGTDKNLVKMLTP